MLTTALVQVLSFRSLNIWFSSKSIKWPMCLLLHMWFLMHLLLQNCSLYANTNMCTLTYCYCYFHKDKCILFPCCVISYEMFIWDYMNALTRDMLLALQLNYDIIAYFFHNIYFFLGYNNGPN